MPRRAASSAYAYRARLSSARNVLRRAMRRRYNARAAMPIGVRRIVANARIAAMRRPVRTAAWSAVKRRVYKALPYNRKYGGK